LHNKSKIPFLALAVLTSGASKIVTFPLYRLAPYALNYQIALSDNSRPAMFL